MSDEELRTDFAALLQALSAYDRRMLAVEEQQRIIIQRLEDQGPILSHVKRQMAEGDAHTAAVQHVIRILTTRLNLLYPLVTAVLASTALHSWYAVGHAQQVVQLGIVGVAALLFLLVLVIGGGK